MANQTCHDPVRRGHSGNVGASKMKPFCLFRAICKILGPTGTLPVMALLAQVVAVSDANADIRIECLADRFLATGNHWRGYTLHDLGLPSLGALDFTLAFPMHAQLTTCCQKIQLRFTAASVRTILPASEENEGGYFVPNVEWTLCTPDTRLFNCYGYNDMSPEKLASSEGDEGVGAGGESDHVSTKKPLSGSWWFVLQHCIKSGSRTASYEVGTFGQSGLSAVSAPRYSGDIQLKPLDNIYVPKVETSSVSPCLIEGEVDTKEQWYGYLATMAVPQDSSISYRFLFKEAEPSNAALLTVLFYSQDDIEKFSATDSCDKKVAILGSQPNTHKLLPLSIGNVWSGCGVDSVNGTPTYTCEGGRNVGKEHTVYIAIANCERHSGLRLYYFFEFQNYASDCPSMEMSDASPRTSGCSGLVYRTLSILISMAFNFYTGLLDT